MTERLSGTFTYPEFRAAILTAFAALAMFLAAIDLYAVLSQFIAQRTQEFRVRMALGARKTDLLKLLLWEGMALTLGRPCGLAIDFSS
jgi:ABC-type antimicrobial peptide transport system permease subunit